jgi:monomeric sarcosine oxidase
MRTEVVIVGGGLAGSAAAWALTRLGRPCVLLEAFQPGHDRGSSHGTARIFRHSYPDPLYVRLTGQARRLWTELEDEAGETLITVTGSLDFGPSDVPRYMYELLQAQGFAAELVTLGDARDRWPGLAVEETDSAMFHPAGGVIDAERVMAAMRRLAAAGGAEIHYGTPAREVTPDGIVRTDDVTYQADTVIVAAGAWLAPLLKGRVPLPELTVTQTSVFHFDTTTRGWPTFIYHDNTDTLPYGLPSGSDAPGSIKVGVHGSRAVTTADERDGVPDSAGWEEARRFVLTKVPGLRPEPSKALTCLYTSTANEDFIIDRFGALVVVSACSGHGAKFAPLVGVFAANLATGAGSPDPRFALANH